MRDVKPQVYLVARPQLDLIALRKFLMEVGGEEWLIRPRAGRSGQSLAEFAGRLCYRSWKPGLNPNVTKVRTDSAAYLENILKQAHGSVLEHACYSFVLHNVSRVLTHELARHRAGVAVSQESMRYVRLDDIPFWTPEWADDPELLQHARDLLARMEWFQRWMAGRFGLDSPDVPFSVKKARTSFMRRFAPDGVATTVLWTANIRTLRHVIEVRTAPGAEEEIRLVFGEVARKMREECPDLFGDFEVGEDGAWTPRYRKV